MVIWLIGISGSGKTTLGVMLKNYFDREGKKSYLIDGDLIRNFYENDLGYTRADRMANIKRIILAAHVLNENGVIPIVCNISPFEELRKFSRSKLNNYNQIYLKKDIELSKRDDVKGVYSENIGKTDVVGVDMKFDEPLNNDLIISVDEETKEESFLRIIDFLADKEF